MNNLTSLQRKLLYLGGIVLLLIPITWLGLPAEPAHGAGNQESPGGYLAQKRAEYGLGESDLGNVDPASSTMNLLLLGFRGIATNLLWMDAVEQQRNKDWASLRATTESIILLQPHFLKVWQFQGWNLAYNVSAEWDGVADRYYWVKEGIKFFKKGQNRNKTYGELFWYTGDTTGKKIGRSDEEKQFRRFFRSDPDEARFKGGPDPDVNPNSRDNYLEAGQWFQQANDTIDKYGIEEHIMAPYLFRAYPARSQFDYAMALQREGNFGEVTQNAWSEGFQQWTSSYGKMQFECELLGRPLHLEVSGDELRAMKATEAARNLAERECESFWISRYQDTTNYRYWRTRSRVESEKIMADAHREIYEGQEALFRADDATARQRYWDGMTKFEKILNEYPDLKGEDEMVEEALLAQIGWRQCLELVDEEVPEQYPLKEFWDEHPSRHATVKQEFDRRRRGAR